MLSFEDKNGMAWTACLECEKTSNVINIKKCEENETLIRFIGHGVKAGCYKGILSKKRKGQYE